jgi:hypothetical protein
MARLCGFIILLISPHGLLSFAGAVIVKKNDFHPGGNIVIPTNFPGVIYLIVAPAFTRSPRFFDYCVEY